jgi:hypothetical protein
MTRHALCDKSSSRSAGMLPQTERGVIIKLPGLPFPPDFVCSSSKRLFPILTHEASTNSRVDIPRRTSNKAGGLLHEGIVSLVLSDLPLL